MANTFKLKTSRAVGTSSTKIGAYDVPVATTSTAIGLTIANITSNTINVSAEIYDGTNATKIVNNATLVPGGTLVAIGGNQKIVMETGMSIRAFSSAASSIDCILSVLEMS